MCYYFIFSSTDRNGKFSDEPNYSLDGCILHLRLVRLRIVRDQGTFRRPTQDGPSSRNEARDFALLLDRQGEEHRHVHRLFEMFLRRCGHDLYVFCFLHAVVFVVEIRTHGLIIVG